MGAAIAAEEEADASRAPEASLNERVLRVAGDAERPVMLQVTLLTPNGPGPFPLAVMNHGATGDAHPELAPRYRFTFSAYYFLSRGYAVALPMMRGYAGSEGKVEHHGCDLETTGINNAKDIRAVINFMKTQPNIDSHRIVMAGQSLGGLNTLAFGTLHYPDVKGLINFAGGLSVSNCVTSISNMVDAAGYFGAHTSVPSIWFYGDNDKVFSKSTWHAMYEHYTSAGGTAELVAYGNFMTDSHQLLSYPEGLHIWVPKVDAFLTRVGLPNKLIYPEYMPVEFPPPTHYAAIDDINAVPYLTSWGRDLYQRFLTNPMPRVFVIASNGMASSYHGGFDPLTKALSSCQKHAKDCRPYAVDDQVVWPMRVSVPSPTHFAEIDDVNAVPFLDDKGKRNYYAFLSQEKPRAFVIASDGTTVSSHGGYDPLERALSICKKNGRNCRPYAVDNQVVWPESRTKTTGQ